MESHGSFEAKELLSPDRTVAGAGAINRSTTSVAAHKAAFALSVACADRETSETRVNVKSTE